MPKTSKMPKAAEAHAGIIPDMLCLIVISFLSSVCRALLVIKMRNMFMFVNGGVDKQSHLRPQAHFKYKFQRNVDIAFLNCFDEFLAKL